LDESESEPEVEESDEETYAIRIVQVRNDNIDAGKNLEYEQLCELK